MSDLLFLCGGNSPAIFKGYPMKEQKIIIKTTVTKKQKKQLDEIARNEKRSLSNLVEIIIEMYLARNKK
jgi:hypothetical protein